MHIRRNRWRMCLEDIMVSGERFCYNAAMSKKKNKDPVLSRFRHELEEIYGDRLERVVLFGSRARGDNHPDSDYDVAVFLRDFDNRWIEIDKIIPVVTDILYSDFVEIQALPYGDKTYYSQTPLMQEIRKDGVEI